MTRPTAVYLERIASRTVTRRFGWLADHAGATVPDDVRAHLLDLAKGGSRAFFGSRRPTPGAIGHQHVWNLTVNVGTDELRESADLARRQTVAGKR